MNISNLLAEDCQIYDCFIHLPKAYQILSKMQNKSPLQVKSVPSVCSRLPSSLGNKAQDLGPISPALDLLLLCGSINPFPAQSTSCLIGHHLACSSHSLASMLSRRFIQPASQIPRKPAVPATHVWLCCSALPLSATHGERLRSPSLFPKSFFIGFTQVPLPLLPLSIYMLCNIFVPQFQCQ